MAVSGPEALLGVCRDHASGTGSGSGRTKSQGFTNETPVTS